MENIERWISHSAMSDTGRHAAAVAELPIRRWRPQSDSCRVVIIHTDWLKAYGVDELQV